jgi:hypothetical protein
MRSRRGVSPINPGALHRMRQMWDLYVSPRRPIEPEGPSYAGTRAADLSSNLRCLPLTAYCSLLPRCLLPLKRRSPRPHSWSVLRTLPGRSRRSWGLNDLGMGRLTFGGFHRLNFAAALSYYFSSHSETHGPVGVQPVINQD